MKKTQNIINQGVVILFLILFGENTLHAQTIPTPTQTDQILLPDNGSAGKADPGDKIRYKVTIENTHPSTPATGVQLNVVPDPRTTFVPGSFLTSPLALPDAYTCTGNVPIFVAAPGIKANDFDEGAPGSLSISPATNQATLRGGSVDIFADGSFEYTPPAGYEGDDSFTYTLNDATQAGPGAPITDVGTVTITISGMIWFINSSAAAGDGRLSSPFNSLGAFNTANGGMTMNNGDVVNPEVNETIFLYTGAGNYTGGIGLLDGQKLFGQGASTANLGILTGITFNPNSIALPMAGGTRPVITDAAGDGVQLGQNNTLRGFDVGACSDFGIDNNGVISVGNLMASEVAINNTTGGGFDASGGSGASMNAIFNSISSTGGTNGINLTNCAGTFTVNGGTITNPGGPGVLIQGGTVVFACSAVVSDNSGFAVDVNDHDNGNVTLSGNITSTGSGIRVQNCNGGTKTFSGSSKNLNTGVNTAVRLISNTGALIDFSGGGLVINTTSGTGFSATGGGTVTVGTGANNNTITTTDAKALNLDGVLANVNFATISAGNAPTEGINLNNLTASSSLVVPGTVTIGMAAGSNANVNISGCTNCTIDLGTNGTTHNAVNLNSRRTSGVILNNASGTIRFGNVTAPNPNSVTVPGIRSTSCSGSTSFAQANVNMNNAGGFEAFTNISTPGDNNGDGDAIYISGFTGTGFAINGGIIENAGDDGIDIRNSTNLTLSNVTIRDCGKNPDIAATVDHNSSGVQALNLTGTNNVTGSTFQRGGLRNFYITQTTGTTTLNINSTCVFDDTRSFGTPATDNLQVYLDGTAIASIDIENSSFLRSRTHQINAVTLGNSQLSKLDITGITMDSQGGPSSGIFIDCFGASTANFNIMNNPKLHSQDENVITIAATGTTQVQGRIKDNPNMKYNGSSSGGSIFSGIRVLSEGTTSVATVLIENNILEIVNCDFGINLFVGGADSPIVNATVNGNTITATGVTHLEGIAATVNNIASVGKLICLTVNNNAVSGAALARVCRLRVLGVTGVRVTNYVTDMNTTWLANGNTGSPVAEGTSGGGTIAAAPVACSVPANPLP